MRVKRLRKDMVDIATWNVMTMLKAGKMNKRPSETQVQMGRRHQKRSEKLKVVKWSDLVQDRHKWKETVEKAKTLQEL